MDYKIVSELGNREVNEDYADVCSDGAFSCFVLCDGLGGHGQGEVASQMVANSLLHHFRENNEISSENISSAFETAQEELLAVQRELNAQNEMKTTAVVLAADSQSAIWGHIGDSRLYLFNKNKIILRTLDHSVPQMLVMAGEIKEKQIRNHPDRNRLMRVMGSEWENRRYDISEPADISKCQAFLLCSDGFWEYITEKQMCRFLKKSKSSEEWMSLMMDEVRKNGAGADMDNHTAIAVII